MKRTISILAFFLITQAAHAQLVLQESPFPALTGDVTSPAGSPVTTVAAIQGNTVSGTTGTGNVVFSASPGLTGTVTITSSSASALDVGANGATNPVLSVDDSTTSVATGVAIKGAATGGTTTLTATDSGSNTGISLRAKGSGTANILTGSGGTISQTINSTTIASQIAAGYTYTPTATGTSTIHWLMTGPADTTLTAGTEIPEFKIDAAANTRQHATGALTTQSAVLMTGTTDSFVGASTITDDSTLRVVPPSAGTNATITNSEAILVQTQALSGTVGTGNGLKVVAPTGATTNYAATFVGTTNTTGGQVAEIRVVTASGAVTVTGADFVVEVDKTTGAATTVNLPSSPVTGTIFYIKDGKGDAATNNITITPAAGNIDGSGTYVMNVNHQATQIQYDGTQWIVL